MKSFFLHNLHEFVAFVMFSCIFAGFVVFCCVFLMICVVSCYFLMICCVFVDFANKLKQIMVFGVT